MVRTVGAQFLPKVIAQSSANVSTGLSCEIRLSPCGFGVEELSGWFHVKQERVVSVNASRCIAWRNDGEGTAPYSVLCQNWAAVGSGLGTLETDTLLLLLPHRDLFCLGRVLAPMSPPDSGCPISAAVWVSRETTCLPPMRTSVPIATSRVPSSSSGLHAGLCMQMASSLSLW